MLALAQARNPRLQALQAAAEAAAYRAPEASTLPDPMLQLGVMNFGLPDFNTDMPTSMAPSVQVMQMLPFPGKLSLKGDIAAYGTEMAEAGADEAWWDVRGRASSMFYDLYSLDRRLEVMRSTLALLKDFQQVAKAMYVAGTRKAGRRASRRRGGGPDGRRGPEDGGDARDHGGPPQRAPRPARRHRGPVAGARLAPPGRAGP